MALICAALLRWKQLVLYNPYISLARVQYQHALPIYLHFSRGLYGGVYRAFNCSIVPYSCCPIFFTLNAMIQMIQPLVTHLQICWPIEDPHFQLEIINELYIYISWKGQKEKEENPMKGARYSLSQGADWSSFRTHYLAIDWENIHFKEKRFLRIPIGWKADDWPYWLWF